MLPVATGGATINHPTIQPSAISPPMRTFSVIRHAESLSNAGVPGAGPNPGLSPLGRQQAHALAACVAASGPVAEIWSSPFERAVQTAHAVADAADTTVRLVPALHEFFYADWFDLDTLEMPSLREIESGHPRVVADRDDAHWWPTQPEDYADLHARLEALAERLVREAKPGKTLFVGHGASVAALTTALVPSFEPLTQEVRNASVTEIQCDGGLCSLVRWNDVSHLV